MNFLQVSLLIVWGIAPLVFGYLNWKVRKAIRVRMKVLGTNHQAGLIGRDYIMQSNLGLGVAISFFTVVVLQLANSKWIGSQVAATLLFFAIPLLFLLHSIYLYRRVVRPSDS